MAAELEAAGPRLWAGIDAGKGHHWVCVVDGAGETVWSGKVINDETVILDTLGAVVALGGEITWGIDITGTASGLLLTLLAAHAQTVRYVPGRTVNRMSGAYRGEAKTDARDAYVIAETVRHRSDLAPVEVPAEIVAELRLLVALRADLVADRVRLINRLRDTLTGYFPGLERAFDFGRRKGAIVLLTRYQTPDGLRRAGRVRVASWLAKRKVRSAAEIADTALDAADAQHTTVPGQKIAAQIVAEHARALLALDARITMIDAQVDDTFHAHPQAAIIESMPGIGPILGAELIVAAGDLSAYADAGRLASAAGLVPVPRDSGRRTGNMHRPKRYNRTLRRVFYLSAQTAIVRDGPNRDFYLKKRAEGSKHVSALLALARRRVDVLYALLRDNRTFTIEDPAKTATAA